MPWNNRDLFTKGSDKRMFSDSYGLYYWKLENTKYLKVYTIRWLDLEHKI